jgi:hypothetical protein
MGLLVAFAAQAAAAVEAARPARDPRRLLREVIAAAAGESLDDAALDTLASAAATELQHDGSPSSALVEVASAWQGRPEADVRLLTGIVEAFARHR